jgi:hypothetical protein
LHEASRTRAQRAIALRSWCQQQSTYLQDHPIDDSCADWRMAGRSWVLDDVVNGFQTMSTDTKPLEVHKKVESLLDWLAEKKALWLTASKLMERIREEERFLPVIWAAEGVVGTIDELVSKMWSLLSAQWNRSDKKQGQYYCVYHAVGHEAMLNVQVGIERWTGAQRARFYQEVALLKAEGLHEVFRLTNHVEGSWCHTPEVFWFRKDMPLRSTSTGDLVVSLASGAAWIVDHVGFQRMVSPNGDYRAATVTVTAQNLQEVAERMEAVLKDRHFTFIQHPLEGPLAVEEHLVLTKPHPSTPFILVLQKALHVHQTDGTTNGTVSLPVGVIITIRDREIDIDLQGRYTNRSRFHYRIED